MSLPDAGQPEEYTEEEMTQLLKRFETDKAALTKNQKAAVARYNVKKGKGETIAFRAPGAAPAAAAPAAAAAPGLSPEMQALAEKDPATLTKEERIALAKAKSQAARAAMAAEAGAAPGEPAKPKGPSPEELARQKARSFPHVPKLEARLGNAVKDVAMQTDVPYLIVDAAAIPEVLKTARDEFGFTYMQNMTAADYPPDRMELVYNLWNMTEKTYIAVKARIPRADPVAPSVEPIFRMADWQEREMYDMFGIRFEGHPYLKRLLLPEGWEGYPLRKDYDVTREQFIALDERGNDVVSFKEDEGW